MGKFGDIFTGEHRRFAWFVVVVTTIFIGLWIFGPGNTIVDWIKASNEIRVYEESMEFLRQDIERMNRNIEELKTDKDTLEKFARERFKFAAPGEDVYIIDR